MSAVEEPADRRRVHALRAHYDRMRGEGVSERDAIVAVARMNGDAITTEARGGTGGSPGEQFNGAKFNAYKSMLVDEREDAPSEASP
jgi:hypothetical protein